MTKPHLVAPADLARTSAAIISFPGAAVAPVINPKHRGRWPKGVVSIRQWQFNRQRLEADAREVRDEYKKQCETVEVLRTILHTNQVRKILIAQRMVRMGVAAELLACADAHDAAQGRAKP